MAKSLQLPGVPHIRAKGVAAPKSFVGGASYRFCSTRKVIFTVDGGQLLKAEGGQIGSTKGLTVMFWRPLSATSSWTAVAARPSSSSKYRVSALSLTLRCLNR